MKRVSVAWQPDQGRFEATGSHLAYPIAINAPHDGEVQGFSASELLLASLGSCSAWDVVEILRKKRQPLAGIEVRVEGEQAPDAPWPFVRLEVVYRVTGSGLDRTAVDHAVRLSSERYCCVIATVSGVATVTTRIEFADADEAIQPGVAARTSL